MRGLLVVLLLVTVALADRPPCIGMGCPRRTFPPKTSPPHDVASDLGGICKVQADCGRWLQGWSPPRMPPGPLGYPFQQGEKDNWPWRVNKSDGKGGKPKVEDRREK
ncbi:unnamed protein product, partial [Mesorhabditis spiculigera]